ncbi:MAG: thiamine diphosphokinase [Ruminococcus sp.]|nr:thiamine diphosphokinase [Ruminococcus sp.]
MGEMNRAVIFAGAPVQPKLQPPVPKASYYICADAGLRLADALQIQPDYIIGDFDSLQYVPTSIDYEKIKKVPVQKDETDTILAAQYAISQGCTELVFYGALGGRIDHMIANIQMLQMLANDGVQGILIDENHWITIQRNCIQHYMKRDGYFSLFALTEQCKGVTMTGVAYPLQNSTLRSNFPIGVSNQIIEPEATVKVDDGDLLIIFSKD